MQRLAYSPRFDNNNSILFSYSHTHYIRDTRKTCFALHGTHVYMWRHVTSHVNAPMTMANVWHRSVCWSLSKYARKSVSPSFAFSCNLCCLSSNKNWKSDFFLFLLRACWIKLYEVLLTISQSSRFLVQSQLSYQHGLCWDLLGLLSVRTRPSLHKLAHNTAELYTKQLQTVAWNNVMMSVWDL